MKRGSFITIEGIDGSGKTTQLELLRKHLVQKGLDVLMLREPGGTRISERIRELILDREFTEMCSTSELLLYAAARAQLVSQVIKPAVTMGKVVICDRFIDSTYAYQGYGRGIPFALLEGVNNIATGGMLPDVTFLFDIDPTKSLERRMRATAADRIENEKLDFHKRVHEGYISLAERFPLRIKLIDADRPVEDIFKDVREHIDNMNL